MSGRAGLSLEQGTDLVANGELAGGLGFEPRLAESESAVLPLDDPPTVAAKRECRLSNTGGRSCKYPAPGAGSRSLSYSLGVRQRVVRDSGIGYSF